MWWNNHNWNENKMVAHTTYGWWSFGGCCSIGFVQYIRLEGWDMWIDAWYYCRARHSLTKRGMVERLPCVVDDYIYNGSEWSIFPMYASPLLETRGCFYSEPRHLRPPSNINHGPIPDTVATHGVWLCNYKNKIGIRCLYPTIHTATRNESHRIVSPHFGRSEM
jgi:hypothetical protein